MIGITNILGAGGGSLKPIDFELNQNSWEEFENPYLGTHFKTVLSIGCKEDDILQVFFDQDSYSEAQRCVIIANITAADELTFYSKFKANFNLTGKYVIGAIEGGGSSPVIGVKGEAETDYRVGKVNLTKENLGIFAATEDLSGLMSAEDKRKLDRINAMKYDYVNECIKIPAMIGTFIPDDELLIIS